MTPEQRQRLIAFLPALQTMARRQHPPNARHKALRIREVLIEHLKGGPTWNDWTPEQWVEYAEKAAAGADQPGTISLTLEQLRSGKPPEAFMKKEE